MPFCKGNLADRAVTRNSSAVFNTAGHQIERAPEPSESDGSGALFGSNLQTGPMAIAKRKDECPQDSNLTPLTLLCFSRHHFQCQKGQRLASHHGPVLVRRKAVGRVELVRCLRHTTYPARLGLAEIP